MSIPKRRKFVGGLEAHYYTATDPFEDDVLAGAISPFSEVEGVESPVVVLPDVSHKADRISPTGMTLATGGSIVPAAVPAANGSGVRIASLDLDESDLNQDRIARFLHVLSARIPIYGEDSPSLIRGRLRESDLHGIYREGVPFLIDRLGLEESIERIESDGAFPVEIESSENFQRFIPDYFMEQGLHNFGILESGNHFIELQIVDEILNPELARSAGLETGRAVLMIHDGSPASLVGQYFHPRLYAKARESERFETDKRAYHERFRSSSTGDCETAGDDLDSRFFAPSSPYYSIEEGTPTHERFMALMGMACNFGLANRAFLQHIVEDTLQTLFGRATIRCQTLTDTLHDCVKKIKMGEEAFMVHRHGASEARPASSYVAGHPFAETGQLLAIPGAPGRPSFLAAAANTDQTWHTANHGAGRKVDRGIARARFEEAASIAAVEKSGAALLRGGLASFSGEHPEAYKDGSEVLGLAEEAGLLRGVARFRPVAIYKG